MTSSTATTPNFIDYYQLFSLQPEWDIDKIRKELLNALSGTKARVNAATGEKRKQIDLTLKRITEARKILTDPDSKAEYDAQRAEWLRTATSEQKAAAAAVPTLAELWALIDAGRYQDAVQGGKRLVEHSPDNDQAWEVYGIASYFWSDLPTAIYAAEQAIRCNPQNAEYYADSGQYYAAAERWNEAETQLNRAIQLSPTTIAYKLTLSDIYRMNSDWGKAEAVLQGVLSQEPSNSVAKSFMAIVIGARAEEKLPEIVELANQGKKKEARKLLKEVKADFEKAQSLAEHDPDIRELLNSESIMVRRALGVNSYQRILGLLVDGLLALPGLLIMSINNGTDSMAIFFGCVVLALVLGYSWIYLAYKNNGQDLTKRLLGMQIVNDEEDSVPAVGKLSFRAILKPITLGVIFVVISIMIFLAMLPSMMSEDGFSAVGAIIGLIIGLTFGTFKLLWDLCFVTDKDLAPTGIGIFLFLHDKLTGTTVACSTKDDFMNLGEYNWY